MMPASDAPPPGGAATPIRSPRRWLRSAVICALGLVTVAALLLRVPSIAQPLGIDQSLWASAVFGMEHGQRLYRDVWEQRPPGIYWIYLAGFRILGWVPATVAWLDIFASVAMTAILFVIVRRLAAPLMATLAAALYAVLTMPAWLYGHGGFLERSVSETFIVVCVGLAAWSAVRSRESPSPAPAFALGLFAGAAVVLKPNAGLYLPALLLWIVLYTRSRPRALIPALAATIVGSAIVPVLAIGWLWSQGTLQDARIAVIDFNRYYVGQGWSPAGYAIDFSKAVWLRIKTDPLWLAGTAGTLLALFELARRRRLPPLAGLAMIWGSAAAIVIIVNGARLFNSYFINALPPLAIMAAWLLAPAESGVGRERHGRQHTRKAIAVVVAAAMTVLLIQRGYVERVGGWVRADIDVLRDDTERTAYLEQFGGYATGRGYSARAHAELASHVGSRTGPEDRIFLFGINGAGVYFLTGRLTAHRFLRANFFVETDFPDPAFRLESVIEDLQSARPRYLIFERLHSPSAMGQAVDALPHHPQITSLLDDYVFERQIEDFALFRRR